MSNNPNGRPLKFKTAQELGKKIESYFDQKFSPQNPPTITGLALHLDCTKQTLLNYQERDEFFEPIKRAKLIIEAWTEKALFNKGIPTAGVIFNLTNNWGWRNPQHVESRNINANAEYSSVDEAIKAMEEAANSSTSE